MKKISLKIVLASKLGFVMASLLLSGCIASGIYSNVDETINFKNYNTYAWLPNGDSLEYAAYDRERIHEAIVDQVPKELQFRGMRLNRENPDMIVGVHTMFEEQTRTMRQPIYRSYGYYPGWYINPWYGPYYFYGFTTMHPFADDYIETVPYTEGTLVIDVVDKESNKIVWRGWTRNEIDPVRFVWDVEDYVHKIFEKYPINTVYPKDKEITSPINTSSE